MKRLIVCLGVLSMLQQIDANAAEKILKNETVIHSTVEKAWQAMATTEGVKAWMVKNADIEVKMMGKYHTNYNANLGDPGTITNTILSYIPNRMISFKLGYPENFTVPDENGKMITVPEVVKASTVFAVTEFEDVGNGNIRVTVTLAGFQEGREWDLTYNFFRRGNDYSLRELKKYLAAH